MCHFSYLKWRQASCICQLLLSNKPYSKPVAESSNVKLGWSSSALMLLIHFQGQQASPGLSAWPWQTHKKARGTGRCLEASAWNWHSIMSPCSTGQTKSSRQVKVKSEAIYLPLYGKHFKVLKQRTWIWGVGWVDLYPHLCLNLWLPAYQYRQVTSAVWTSVSLFFMGLLGELQIFIHSCTQCMFIEHLLCVRCC